MKYGFFDDRAKEYVIPLTDAPECTAVVTV